MKPNTFVNVIFCAVILDATLLSKGILHEKKKGLSRTNTIKRKNDDLKGNGAHVLRKTSGKAISAGNVLRPERITHISGCSDLDRGKSRRCGCHVCHHIQPCVGGCMQPPCNCHKECDEGCWCPIPGAEEAAAPKKKPEEPCCCPCCCPCCPRPCCHHIHHHHFHCCCPCCHCCHCCHCCPCCCQCCHCKRSQSVLLPSLVRTPLYLCFYASPFYADPVFNAYGVSILRNGPLRAP